MKSKNGTWIVLAVVAVVAAFFLYSRRASASSSEGSIGPDALMSPGLLGNAPLIPSAPMQEFMLPPPIDGSALEPQKRYSVSGPDGEIDVFTGAQIDTLGTGRSVTTDRGTSKVEKFLDMGRTELVTVSQSSRDSSGKTALDRQIEKNKADLAKAKSTGTLTANQKKVIKRHG